MTSFTFTPEQVQSAPPEVRRWIVQEIGRALAVAQRPAHDPSQAQRARLGACSVDEAVQILGRIRGDFVLMQVFFELARDAAPGRSAPSLHVLDVADMLQHTRLRSGDGLLQSLEAINAVYRDVRREPEATLFGFDDHGHLDVHHETHLSIRHLWDQLSRPGPVAIGAPAAAFATPHPGPSQNVASHVLGSVEGQS